MSQPVTHTFTAAKPVYQFNSRPGSVHYIATSGVADGATITVQHRATEEDPWVTNVQASGAAGALVYGMLVTVAFLNRIIVTSPGGATKINLIVN